MELDKHSIWIGGFILSCFSLFVALVPIYVPIFWIFIVMSLWFFLSEKSKVIDTRALVLIVLALSFMGLASFIFFKYREQSSFSIYFKILTNYSFFAAAVLMLAVVRLRTYLKWFEALFITVLVLSFLQVLGKVIWFNLWMLPFSIEDSSDAFAISQGITLFGNAQKNIWATKIAFFGSLYFSACYFRIFRCSSMLWHFLIAMWVFTLFYIASRTGQVVMVLFFLGLFWYSVIKKLPWYWRFLMVFAFCIFLWLFVPWFIERLLRLDESVFDVAAQGHGGDGFKARIKLWIYLLTHLSDFNHFRGNGVMFLDHFFEGVFHESNIHNVFATIWIDLGLLGFLLFLTLAARVLGLVGASSSFFVLVGIPFLASLMVQYLGYDNDLVVYLSLALLLADLHFNYFRKQELV